jgi:hypothetical protein
MQMTNVFRKRFLALLPLCTALVAACGSSDPSGDADTDSCNLGSGSLLPWKVGNKWTYKVTEDGEISMKVTTIEAQEMVGGNGPNASKMAFKVVTKKGANDQTISWQAPQGDKVVRYREQSYSKSTGMLELEEHWDPYKLHVDGSAEHMAMNAKWLEEYQETKQAPSGGPVTKATMDFWTVAAPCQTVQVGSDAYKAIKLTKAGGDLKTYWYVPGIGKVKETGGQTEELVSKEVSQ